MKKILLFSTFMLLACCAMAQSVISDVYAVGYYKNNNYKRAVLDKNSIRLYEVGKTRYDVVPQKVVVDSDENVYWLINYYYNNNIRYSEVRKNDQVYITTENQSGVRIIDIYCLNNTLYYAGNQLNEDSVSVVTVWKGTDFTIQWVLGDGIHNSYLADADVDQSTGIPYFCGSVEEDKTKAVVWKAGELFYKYDVEIFNAYSSVIYSNAREISVDNGNVYTLGRFGRYYDEDEFELYCDVVWKNNEVIKENGGTLLLENLCAYESAYYYCMWDPHGASYDVIRNGSSSLLWFNLWEVDADVSCIKAYSGDVYMSGYFGNKGCVWNNFTLFHQFDNSLNVVDIELVENDFAFQTHFDFSAVCETGQPLYYRISSEEEHTITLTYPYSEENPGFEFNYYEYFVKPEGEVVIPAVVVNNGVSYAVTEIDPNTFWDCEVTSVVIPSSVRFVAPFAFGSCASLESIVVDENNPTLYSESNAVISREDKKLLVGCKTTTIPDDVEIIGKAAFYCSGEGGDMVIPNSVRIIEESAFSYSGFTGTLTLSEALETIGYSAFAYSRFSGSLVIPNSVTAMDTHTFFSCDRFHGSLTLSSSLSTISNVAFSKCNFSGTLVIPDAVNQIGAFAFDGNDFSSLVLGESLESIGNGAFRGCNCFSGALRLPTSVTLIDQWAFMNTSFDEIHSPNAVPPTLFSNSFSGYDPNIPVHIPYGCTEAYQNAEGWNYFTNFVEPMMNFEGEWYYEIINEWGGVTYQHLECTSDTTINGKKSKVIVRTNQIYDKDSHDEVTHEYVYEEENKLYWWNKTLGEFTVLYDFTAEQGDEWEIKVGTERVMVHVDSVGGFDYQRFTQKVLHVSDDRNIFSGDIVMGLGHLTNFFPEKLMSNRGYRVEGLRCYWEGEALLYHHGEVDCDAVYSNLHGVDETNMENVFIYPNPTTTHIFVITSTIIPNNVITNNVNPTFLITNQLGQTVLSGVVTAGQIDVSSLSQGLYFITIGNETLKFVKQ